MTGLALSIAALCFIGNQPSTKLADKLQRACHKYYSNCVEKKLETGMPAEDSDEELLLLHCTVERPEAAR